MHEDFERYKTGLDRVRLTAESKKALTESLRRRRTADRPEIRTRRLRLGRVGSPPQRRWCACW